MCDYIVQNRPSINNHVQMHLHLSLLCTIKGCFMIKHSCAKPPINKQPCANALVFVPTLHHQWLLHDQTRLCRHVEPHSQRAQNNFRTGGGATIKEAQSKEVSIMPFECQWHLTSCPSSSIFQDLLSGCLLSSVPYSFSCSSYRMYQTY